MNGPRPPRVTLGNLEGVPETLEAQYNPESLEETIQVVYQEIEVQGLSHGVKQYKNTKSWVASFDLAFDGLSHVAYDGDRMRKLLMSWCYPRRGAGDVASGSPTRVLFVWPGLVSLSAVIEKLTYKHKRFAWTGLDLATTMFICSVSVSEIRDARLFADDVARNGTIRTTR